MVIVVSCLLVYTKKKIFKLHRYTESFAVNIFPAVEVYGSLCTWWPFDLMFLCMCLMHDNPGSCACGFCLIGLVRKCKNVKLAHSGLEALCSCSPVCRLFQIVLFNMFLCKPTINKLTALHSLEEQELPEVNTLK